LNLNKRVLKALLFAALAALLFSCSSSRSRYNFDFPFSDKLAYPSDSSFSVAIPQGWYQVEDNECNCNNILLMRNGLKASLNLIPVAMDNVSAGRIEKEPLTDLIKYSKIIKSQKTGISLRIIEKENFKSDEIPVRAYKYLNSKGFEQRVVVFSIGGNYFELNGNSATTNKDVLNDLFAAQNSLIKMIGINKHTKY